MRPRKTIYKTVGDIDNPFYKPTITKLVHKGLLFGQGGENKILEIDLSEDAVRLLVVLDRTGLIDKNSFSTQN